MKIGRLIIRVLSLMAVFFIISQPILVPITYAVEPWTGEPWQGKSWEGKPWDGRDLQWNGKTWTGDGTDIQDNEQPTMNDSSNKPETRIDELNDNNSDGDKSTELEHETNNKSDEDSPNDQNKTFLDSTAYKAWKWGANDVILGTIKNNQETMFDLRGNYKGIDYGNVNWNRLGFDATRGALTAFLPENAKYAKMGVDVWQGADNYNQFFKSPKELKQAWNRLDATRDIYNNHNKYSKIKNIASNTKNILSKSTKNPVPITGWAGKIAGKVTPWTAAASAGISGVETVVNFSNGEVNKGIASLGETLMSSAVVASATGVGAPIAAGMAIVGFGLWAGAKVYEHWNTVTKTASKVWEGTKNLAKNVGNGVKDAAKSVVNTVGGWFS